MAKIESDSLGSGAGALLFKGVLYLLYGRRAGETETEKTVRAGVIIIFLIAVFLALSALVFLIREYLEYPYRVP
ncbi:MAG: hypothetical protein DDT32_02066 [Syntrophomonadaceae bacterium]|nr:hypothetical protein [Bacillota bacterium]MBT9148294.1 hypothetical protein [Bacillota bacterium]